MHCTSSSQMGVLLLVLLVLLLPANVPPGRATAPVCGLPMARHATAAAALSKSSSITHDAPAASDVVLACNFTEQPHNNIFVTVWLRVQQALPYHSCTAGCTRSCRSSPPSLPPVQPTAICPQKAKARAGASQGRTCLHECTRSWGNPPGLVEPNLQPSLVGMRPVKQRVLCSSGQQRGTGVGGSRHGNKISREQRKQLVRVQMCCGARGMADARGTHAPHNLTPPDTRSRAP